MGQLKVLARFSDSVSLEVRIVDRIINFRSTLVNVLMFCHSITTACLAFAFLITRFRFLVTVYSKGKKMDEFD